jgi:hypothetical protein
MKTALIRSNHGNHRGFNVKWQLINVGTAKQNKALLASYSEEIEDGHTFAIISQSTIDCGFFNGGFNGYFPSCLKDIFKSW